MNVPEVWLSAPATRLLGSAVDNEGVLARVRARFQGGDKEWDRVERRIRSLWRICGTERRHLADESDEALGVHAAAVAELALAEAGLAARDLDLVLYGSIARSYYEPATAAEVASRIGAARAMPLDVTSACAGAVLAAQDVVGRMAMDPALSHALVCTATMTGRHVTYGLRDADDVDVYGAGLTLGHAATAMLLTRSPTPRCGRVVGVLSEGIPEHWALCRAPVEGVFESDGVRIFALSRHVPAHARRLCDRVGWRIPDVDLFVAHQPSNRVLQDMARGLEVDASRVPQLHGLFGNTADSAVPLALRHLVDAGVVRPGMKMILSTAASGFVMASLAVVWER
ncbi:MAG: 3-oxoacyl-ACP synthase III family protein [Myxococcota bacterium]